MLLALSKGPTTPADIAMMVIFFGSILLVGALFELVRSRLRRSAMQRLAASSKLCFADRVLPTDFPAYESSPPPGWRNGWGNYWPVGYRYGGHPSNVVSGMRGGELLVAFDIEVHMGLKRAIRVTLVALRSDKIRPRPEVPSSLYYSEEGDWRIVQKRAAPYRESSLVLRPAYIESLWKALS